MKQVGTYISNNCTRKVLVYVDKNGHYEIRRLELQDGEMMNVIYGRSHFKHIESAQRAIKKWIT